MGGSPEPRNRQGTVRRPAAELKPRTASPPGSLRLRSSPRDGGGVQPVVDGGAAAASVPDPERVPSACPAGPRARLPVTSMRSPGHRHDGRRVRHRPRAEREQVRPGRAGPWNSPRIHYHPSMARSAISTSFTFREPRGSGKADVQQIASDSKPRGGVHILITSADGRAISDADARQEHVRLGGKAALVAFAKAGLKVRSKVRVEHAPGIRTHGKSSRPRTRAASLGAPPGRRLKVAESEAVLAKIAAASLDLFPTLEQAYSYLQSPNFAGTGKDARELVRAGAAATVLGRLDELRYGGQG